jgi:hypothetical protein
MAGVHQTPLVSRLLPLALLLATGCVDAPPATPLAGRAALVITTDFQTGSYAAIRRSDHEVVPNIEVIHQDASCRFDLLTGYPLIVARLGADAIDIVDPAQSWQVIGEYSVGAGTNPQDIAVVAPDRAYVSRLTEPGLLVVHPLTGDVIEQIDLSGFADADGSPEPAGLLHHDGMVYALLLQLENMTSTGTSTLLTIDGPSGAVLDQVELSAPNPAGRLRYSDGIGALVLVESGEFGDHGDGVIETFDPATGTLSGPLIDEAALGGDLVDAVIATATKGYAAIGETIGSEGNSRVVTFDPTAGTKTGDLIAADSFDHLSLELTPEGDQLWVPDRKQTAPGIRIFDVATDDEITTAPIDVGLPPFVICFVDDQ